MPDYFYKDINNISVPEFHTTWFNNIPKLIGDDILERVEEYVSRKDLEQAATVGGEGSDIRRSEICWLVDTDYRDLITPVYDEISRIVRDVNDDLWGYNIRGWEGLQYSKYDSEYKGHYDWHMDISPRQLEGLQRKVSFSIGLSKDYYEGGEFEFMISRDTQHSFKLSRGDMLVFPSFLLHRVTPVTSGIRNALVGWGLGTNFV
jgi:PKHD-type hydroxylase